MYIKVCLPEPLTADQRSLDPPTMPDDVGRKLKKENGSPGRARTADLVINSSRVPV